MAKNITLTYTIDKISPIPTYYATDVEWLHHNRVQVQRPFSEGVVIVYRQQVIGFGATIDEAEANALKHLLQRDDIPDDTTVLACRGYTSKTSGRAVLAAILNEVSKSNAKH